MLLDFHRGFSSHHAQQDLDPEVEYLHPTDEREASEEPHGSSYSGQLVYKLGCSVLNQSKLQS